jgi:hypothetical protein
MGLDDAYLWVCLGVLSFVLALVSTLWVNG